MSNDIPTREGTTSGNAGELTRTDEAMFTLAQIAAEHQAGVRGSIPVVVDGDHHVTTLSTTEMRALEHAPVCDVMALLERIPDEAAQFILDEITEASR